MKGFVYKIVNKETLGFYVFRFGLWQVPEASGRAPEAPGRSTDGRGNLQGAYGAPRARAPQSMKTQTFAGLLYLGT